MIRRLLRFGPSILAAGPTCATFFRLGALCLHEPRPDGGAEGGGPSPFVYAMY